MRIFSLMFESVTINPRRVLHISGIIIAAAMTSFAPWAATADFAAGSGGYGGGAPLPSPANCISDSERKHAEANISNSFSKSGRPAPRAYGSAAPYPFVPIAGTEWQDRFVNNFVDLDPSTSGILDWDCTDYTYDGHTGHDIDLRSFSEQDIGSPVFAALDGTVTDAHDGEFDRNTAAQGQPANYVILFHGGTHYTWYWHLRKNSVAVSVGQFVRAGTTLGMAASSGNSTGPHLHFESHLNGTWFEPSAGSCRAGGSGWVNQIPVRRDPYIEDFGVHNTNNYPSSISNRLAATGTIVRNGTFQPIGAWYVLHNYPANSSWRARYLRPNGTLFFDSGNHSYGVTYFARYSWWWLYYNLNPDVAGTWNLELSLNGQVMLTAPFTVLDPGGVVTNRPPGSVTAAAFDPPAPRTNDVVFCRLTSSLTEDPDYDLVRFRYQWRTNGILFRDVTNAAYSDAIPSVIAPVPVLLTCTVTPFDGLAFGPSNVQQAVLGPAPRLVLSNDSAAQLLLRWQTSAVPFKVEGSTGAINSPLVWAPLTNAISQSGSENRASIAPSQGVRYFRLRWP